MSGIPHPTGDHKTDKKNWGNYTRPGDIHHSKCHDCLGAIIWLILFAALIAILVVGVSKGRPWAMLNSWDDTGNYCGYDNTKLSPEIKNLGNFTLYNFTDFKFSFYGRIKIDGMEAMCVKECPESNVSLEDALLDECPDSERICPAYLTEEQKNQERKKGGLCVCPYKTKAIFNRCIPDIEGFDGPNASQIIDQIDSMISIIPGFGQSITSLVDLWLPILVASAASLIVALIWICMLGCVAGCIVYLSILLIPALFIVLGIWLFFFGDDAFQMFKPEYSKYMAYALWAVAALLLLIIIFIFKKLKSAVSIIKMSAKALRKNLTIIFTPIIALVLILLFWAAVIVSSVFNYTACDFSIVNQNGISKLSFDFSQSMQYLLIFNLVYAVFISVFVYFENYFAMSSSLVSWYFSDHSKGCCHINWLYGYLLGFTKYLGTITATALLMTPLYLFIIIMEYIDMKTKKNKDSISCFVKFIIKCCKCCLWCFEKIMRFLNKGLLTIAQIYNRSWIKSAAITFKIVLSDVVLTLVVNGVSTFILFLSKIIVAGITTLGFVIYIKYNELDASGWILPAVAVFIISFIVSSFFINLFDSVIDAILICYQSDCDLTKSGADHPMYISEDMNDMIKDIKTSGAKNDKIEARSD